MDIIDLMFEEETFAMSYIDPEGNEWLPGECIPILRLPGVTLFNELVIIAACDECEWVCCGPGSVAYDSSMAHALLHGQIEGGDESPSYTP